MMPKINVLKLYVRERDSVRDVVKHLLLSGYRLPLELIGKPSCMERTLQPSGESGQVARQRQATVRSAVLRDGLERKEVACREAKACQGSEHA